MTRRELRERVKPQKSHTKHFKRRMISKLLSGAAMAGAALMIVATSVPANAFFSAEVAMSFAKSSPVVEELQSSHSHAMPLDVATPAVSRDGYTATSLKEQIFLVYGNRSYLYTPNPNGTIRWPFPIAVPIGSGFGYRSAPCSGCSSDHKGLDLNAGNGAPIGAIADGVVISAISDSWGYGQHVIVEHAINGQRVQSLYAHMQAGSIRVSEGDQLKAGDVVGLLGSTGASTGPHLHLEIHVNGVPVDPFAWLQANQD